MVKLFAAFLCSLVLIGNASAAKNGITFLINPATPTVGQSAVFSGCGYPANNDVALYYEANPSKSGVSPDSYLVYPATDANGCFSYNWIPDESGEWYAIVYAGSGHNDSYHLKAKLEFDVN